MTVFDLFPQVGRLPPFARFGFQHVQNLPPS
jgi:hypothetical protein